MNKNILTCLEDLANSCETTNNDCNTESQNISDDFNQIKKYSDYQINKNGDQNISDDFNWIKKYCDYQINKNGDLICTNSNNNIFKISSKNKVYFKNSISSWINNVSVIKNFSKFSYDFDYINRSISLKIHDLLFSVYDLHTISDCISTLKNEFRICDKGYECVIFKGNNDPIKINTACIKYLLKNPTKYITDVIFHIGTQKIINYITDNTFHTETSKLGDIFDLNNTTNFINYPLKLDQLKIVMKIKQEINTFLITELGRKSSNSEVVSLLRKVFQKLDFNKIVYEKTQRLIESIKERDSYNKTKNNYDMICKSQTNYAKCMDEIRGILNDFKVLSSIHYDTFNKFINIWTIDSLIEFQKRFDLTRFEFNLADKLYSLDKSKRDSVLLENNIFL